MGKGNLSMKDLEIIQARLRRESENPAADPADALAALRSDGSFDGVEYFNADRMKWSAQRHIQYLKTMVEAAYSPGNAHFGDAALKDAIARALSYWETCGRADSNNWWWKEIGLPQLLLPILIFAPAEMTPSQRTLLEREADAGSIFHERPTVGAAERPVSSVGANLTDKLMTTFRIYAACGKMQELKTVMALLDNELRVFPRVELGEFAADGEGIKPDGSFHQHLDSLQFGGYGEVFLTGVNFLLRMTEGTQLYPGARARGVYADFLLDGMSWAFRGEYKDHTVTGRGFSRPMVAAQGGSRGIAPFVREGAQLLLHAPDVQRREELETLLQERLTDGDRGKGSRYFWLSDYLSYKQPDFHIGVKTNSMRTKAGEVVNNENLLGYYMSDGVTCILRRGDEYENIYPLWNWNRLPGTTTLQGNLHDLRDAETWWGEDGWNWRGTTTFVGGAADGDCAAAVMDYARDGLFAHKAWLFTGQEMTALGCCVNTLAKETREVVTNVNQCIRRGDVRLRIGGTWHSAQDGAADVTGTEAIWHDGTAYLVQQGAARLLLEEREGDWGTVNRGFAGRHARGAVFELDICHGVQPQDGAYAYTVAPGLTEADCDKYVPPQILRNDEAVQAVCKDGRLAAAFWKVGQIDAPGGLCVRANKKCLLLLQETDGGGLRIAVSNPENRSKWVDIWVNRTLAPLESGECHVRPAEGGSTVHFRLNEGVWAGSASGYDSRTGFTSWKSASN